MDAALASWHGRAPARINFQIVFSKFRAYYQVSISAGNLASKWGWLPWQRKIRYLS